MKVFGGKELFCYEDMPQLLKTLELSKYKKTRVGVAIIMLFQLGDKKKKVCFKVMIRLPENRKSDTRVL